MESLLIWDIQNQVSLYRFISLPLPGVEERRSYNRYSVEAWPFQIACGFEQNIRSRYVLIIGKSLTTEVEVIYSVHALLV